MRKILLIEDDPLMLRMYQRVFALEGYEVAAAADGLIGFNTTKSFKPDLILLDIMMPNLNGLQTLEKLKLDDETKHIPVIILTNLANKADAQDTLKKGALKYLVKSDHNPKQVSQIVKEFFESIEHTSQQTN